MSEISRTTSSPAPPLKSVDAVRLDRSSVEAAEKSLREITEKFKGKGKVVFCKDGDDLYAVAEGKGPSKFKSFLRRHGKIFGITGRYLANDEAGDELALLFRGGVGAALREQMNGRLLGSRTWFKRAVDASAFSRALDQDISDRTNRLLSFLVRLNTAVDSQCNPDPYASEHSPSISDDTFDQCTTYLDKVLHNYHHKKKGYHDTRSILEDLENRYVRENGGLPLAPTDSDALISPDDGTHLNNPRTAARYKARQQGKKHAGDLEGRLHEQTMGPGGTIEAVRKLFAPYCTSEEVGEIAEAGLASFRTHRQGVWLRDRKEHQAATTHADDRYEAENRRRWLQMDDPLKSFARQTLDQARVKNAVRNLSCDLLKLKCASLTEVNRRSALELDIALDGVPYLPTLERQLKELKRIESRVKELERPNNGVPQRPQGLPNAPTGYDQQDSSDEEEFNPDIVIKGGAPTRIVVGRPSKPQQTAAQPVQAQATPAANKELFEAFQGQFLDSEFQEIVKAGSVAVDFAKQQLTSQQDRGWDREETLALARFTNNHRDLSAQLQRLAGLDVNREHGRPLQILKKNLKTADSEILVRREQALRTIAKGLAEVEQSLRAEPDLDPDEELRRWFQGHVLPSEWREIQHAGMANAETLEAVRQSNDSRDRVRDLMLFEARYRNNVGIVKRRAALLFSHPDYDPSDMNRVAQHEIDELESIEDDPDIGYGVVIGSLMTLHKRVERDLARLAPNDSTRVNAHQFDTFGQAQMPDASVLSRSAKSTIITIDDVDQYEAIPSDDEVDPVVASAPQYDAATDAFKASLFEALRGNLLDTEFDEIIESGIKFDDVLRIANESHNPKEAADDILYRARYQTNFAYLQHELNQLEQLDAEGFHAKEIDSLREELNTTQNRKPGMHKLGSLDSIHKPLVAIRSKLPRPPQTKAETTAAELCEALKGQLLPSEMREVARAGFATHLELVRARNLDVRLSLIRQGLLAKSRCVNNLDPLKRRIELLASHENELIRSDALEIQQHFELDDPDDEKLLRLRTKECEELIQTLDVDDPIRQAAYRTTDPSAEAVPLQAAPPVVQQAVEQDPAVGAPIASVDPAAVTAERNSVPQQYESSDSSDSSSEEDVDEAGLALVAPAPLYDAETDAFKASLFEALQGSLLDSEFDEIVESKMTFNYALRIARKSKNPSLAVDHILTEARFNNLVRDIESEFNEINQADTDEVDDEQIARLKREFAETSEKAPSKTRLNALTDLESDLASIVVRLAPKQLGNGRSKANEFAETFAGYLTPGQIREVVNARLATSNTIDYANFLDTDRGWYAEKLLHQARYRNNARRLFYRAGRLTRHSNEDIAVEASDIQDKVLKAGSPDHWTRDTEIELLKLTAECEALIQKLDVNDPIRQSAYRSASVEANRLRRTDSESSESRSSMSAEEANTAQSQPARPAVQLVGDRQPPPMVMRPPAIGPVVVANNDDLPSTSDDDSDSSSTDSSDDSSD